MVIVYETENRNSIINFDRDKIDSSNIDIYSNETPNWDKNYIIFCLL